MPYYTWRDLIRARYKTANLDNKPSTGRRIYFDKLLHNNWHVSREIMSRRDVDLIVTIRKPEDAISSIINMGKRYHDIGWYQDHFRAANYYVTRLSVCCEFMENSSRISERRAIFFQAERLLLNPTEILNGLSKRLALMRPLSEKYETFSKTGHPGIGDPSQNIMLGHIESNRAERESIDLDPMLLAWVNRVYEYSIEVAKRNCIVL